MRNFGVIILPFARERNAYLVRVSLNDPKRVSEDSSYVGTISQRQSFTFKRDKQDKEGRKHMSTITTKDGTQSFYKDWVRLQPIVYSHGWPLTADDWDGHM